MTEEELKNLFETLASRYGAGPPGSKQIFALLVQTTLKYRDMLVAQGEKPLTVAETRQAIDELLRVMRLKKFSDPLPGRVKQLVTLWYEKVKVFLYH